MENEFHPASSGNAKAVRSLEKIIAKMGKIFDNSAVSNNSRSRKELKSAIKMAEMLRNSLKYQGQRRNVNWGLVCECISFLRVVLQKFNFFSNCKRYRQILYACWIYNKIVAHCRKHPSRANGEKPWYNPSLSLAD